MFTDVRIKPNCTINMVTSITEDEEYFSEYSPYNIIQQLKNKQIIYEEDKTTVVNEVVVHNSEFRKCVKRFLNKYIKSTYQYESNIKEDPIYNSKNFDLIINEIIPLLIKYDIIEEKSTKNTLQASTKAWVLKKYDLAEIFKAEEDTKAELYEFWKEVNCYKK